MIYRFLVPLFIFATEDKEPIVVRLETEVQLLPMYASSWQFENGGFETTYLSKLEEILRFDLGHNGSTSLLPIKKDLDALTFDALPSWQKAKIYYALKAKVKD